MEKTSHHAIVIGNQWPTRRGGYQYAIEASLRLYSKVFDEVTFIALTDTPVPSAVAERLPSVVFERVTIRRRPKWRRFVRSLVSARPAISSWGTDRGALFNCACQSLQRVRRTDATPYLIVEGTPFSDCIEVFRTLHPCIPVAVRTHEVLSDSFAGIEAALGFFRGLPWRLELAKLERFERRSLAGVDCVWTITAPDARLVETRLGSVTHGINGVCFDADEFEVEPGGNAKVLVCLGSADLRKGLGLRRFLKESWPRVRERVPDACFHIAGAATEGFDDPERGVHGHGYVEDGVDFLRRGAVSVNPQWIGGGLKIKSAVALMAGRALISTSNGVEGIPGVDGQHYLASDDPVLLADHVVALMRDPGRAISMARVGQEMARRIYSRTQYESDTRPEVEAFIRTPPAK